MKYLSGYPRFFAFYEIAFTWSANRGMLHAQKQLTGFSGTLLTDGYAAYSQATSILNQQDANIVHANCWARARPARAGLDCEAISA